jgi:hypothetical protein
MVKHDPMAAPLAPGFRYTENAEAVRPGEGLWKTLTVLGKVQRRYFDAANGQAAYFGQIEEGGDLNLATIRIRVANGCVSETEVVIARKSDIIFDPAGLGHFVPPEEAVPNATRTSREAMVAAADSYFEGIQNHDGRKILAAKGCSRIENGVVTAGPHQTPMPQAGPASQGDCHEVEPFKSTIAAVDHRRFPVVDEEQGVVLGMAIFNRPPGATRSDGKPYPRNLLTEIFEVENGRITNIYAIMHYLQPDIASAPGW